MFNSLNKWFIACTVVAGSFFGVAEAQPFRLPIVSEFAEESADFIELNGAIQGIINRTFDGEDASSAISAGNILIGKIATPFIVANPSIGDLVVDLLDAWYFDLLTYITAVGEGSADSPEARIAFGALVEKAEEFGAAIGRYLGVPRGPVFRDAFVSYTLLLVDEINALSVGDQPTADADIALASALAIRLSRGVALASVSSIINRN